ncbi:hypothetical protein [Weissella confusa]|uniref:hypothetical protein n=1 Tax=Weissella confusa TaxID=1583 RepID=UPI0022E4B737|nr:hypothetical protein [Weissella confusa]
MMDSIGTVTQISRMTFIDVAKRQSIINEFEALNKSVADYYTRVSKKNNAPENVNKTKLQLVGLMEANDKVAVRGLLQNIESRAINNTLFQDNSKETIRSTRQLKRMVESLSIYLDTNDSSILDETLDSARMTAEILSNRLDRIERRAKKSDKIEIELDGFRIGMPKSTPRVPVNSDYSSFFAKGSIGKKENNIKSFLKVW